ATTRVTRDSGRADHQAHTVHGTEISSIRCRTRSMRGLARTCDGAFRCPSGNEAVARPSFAVIRRKAASLLGVLALAATPACGNGSRARLASPSDYYLAGWLPSGFALV